MTVTIDGTNGITLPDTTTFSSTNSFSMKNRFINGAMGIDQRNAGASQTITAAAVLAYTVDRWYAYCTGANVTGQRVSNTGTTASPSQYAYQFTGAASVTAIGFAQRIEAVNCYDLAGTTATLSVNISNSLLTTVTWTAYYATSADTFGTLASPTKTQISTGTFTVTSTLTRYSTNISIPSAATTGIEIVFTVGAQTSGTWIIGNAQLEAGSTATVFERKPITTEIQLCQRYFCLIPLQPGFFSTTSLASDGTGPYYQANFMYPVTIRSSPTLTSNGFSNQGTSATDGGFSKNFFPGSLISGAWTIRTTSPNGALASVTVQASAEM